MSLDITATDLFCGAGGSSQAVENMGARLVMAANHWQLAVESHSANFPHANHDCANVSQIAPRRYPRTDILVASPECTNHSSAKTKKHNPNLFNPEGDPAEERSRATMWDVPRFAEYHRYKIVIVENVVEARKWEPFNAWLTAMHALGYEHKIVFMNSFVAHPTPQSRDRMYVVFWRKGNRAPEIDIRPLSWCAKCAEDVRAVQTWKNPSKPWGKYGVKNGQYYYACPTCRSVALPYVWPAAAAIDWTIPTPRIGDRKKRPLKPATIRRIKAGLARYGSEAVIQAAGHTYERPGYYRTWPTWEPLRAQTATAQHALVVETAYTHGLDANKTRSAVEPMRTQTGRQTAALLLTVRGTHDAAVNSSARPSTSPFGPVTTRTHEALIVALRNHANAQAADGAPLQTVAAAGMHHALLMRQYSGGAEMSRPVSEPTGTVTSIDHHALAVPFLTEYHGTGHSRPVTEPSGTVDTRDRRALVIPDINVDDCGFRMLTADEIGRAMAFPDSYIVKGSGKDRVRQYGNAVNPPAMELLVKPCIESLS